MSFQIQIKDFKPESPLDGDLGKWDNKFWIFKAGQWEEAPDKITLPVHNSTAALVNPNELSGLSVYGLKRSTDD